MVLRTAVRVVVIAVGTLLMFVAGVLAGLSGANISPGDVDSMVLTVVVLRSVLVIALLLALTWFFRIRDRRAADHADRPGKHVLVASGIAYFVNFASWDGHTLFGQLFVPAGLYSMLFDFAVWMLVAIVGVRCGDRVRVQAVAAPIPYV